MQFIFAPPALRRAIPSPFFAPKISQSDVREFFLLFFPAENHWTVGNLAKVRWEEKRGLPSSGSSRRGKDSREIDDWEIIKAA